MSALFEELDYRETPIGALSLRRRRELRLGIDSVAIPAKKRPDGEAMPEVVHARPGVVARASQTDLT